MFAFCNCSNLLQIENRDDIIVLQLSVQMTKIWHQCQRRIPSSTNAVFHSSSRQQERENNLQKILDYAWNIDNKIHELNEIRSSLLFISTPSVGQWPSTIRLDFYLWYLTSSSSVRTSLPVLFPLDFIYPVPSRSFTESKLSALQYSLWPFCFSHFFFFFSHMIECTRECSVDQNSIESNWNNALIQSATSPSPYSIPFADSLLWKAAENK